MTTVDEQVKRALIAAEAAFENYKSTCTFLRAGKATEQEASTALNALIALSYKMKEAALEREPAPLPPRKQQRSK